MADREEEALVLDLRSDWDYVVLGDNAEFLPKLADESIQLIYIDPPFNTGRPQQRKTLRNARDDEGDRTGFRAPLPNPGAEPARLSRRVRRLPGVHRAAAGRGASAAHRASGTLYFHIDYREAHYCKVLLDEIFGRDAFLNEIIWAYDYGGRAKDRGRPSTTRSWSTSRRPGGHFFDQDAIERIPYMAPGLVAPEKAARGQAAH